MGLLDLGETYGANAVDAIGSLADDAAGIPIVGSGVSILQAGYHAGSAVYDGVTGDRDGAIDHGTQALWNGLGAIPAVGQAMGSAELAAGALGITARTGTELAGGDSSAVPDGLDSLAGSWAVGATNAMFGADDSNWIADGTTPQGTRQGEIAAGVNMMLGGPLGLLAGDMDGGIGGGVAELAGSLFGSESKPGSTSGAERGWAAKAGIAAHDELGGYGGGALGGAMLGAAFGPMGMLMGAGLGSTAGYLEENFDISPEGVHPAIVDALSDDSAVPGTGPGLWQSGQPNLGGGAVPGTGPGLWQDKLPDTSALGPIIAGLGTPGMLLPPKAPSGGGAGAAMGATQGQFSSGGAAGGAGAGSAGTVPGAGAAAGGAAAGPGKARPTGGDIAPYLPPMFESVGDLF